MDKISQAYISVDLDPAKLEFVRSLLSNTFHQLGISAERTSSRCHVSLAYVEGDCHKVAIEDIALRLAHLSFEAEIVGVELLEGQTTGYDYIALTLNENSSFADAAQEISSELDTKDFSGGFKTHVSLFQIKKGSVEREAVPSLCRYLLDIAKAHQEHAFISGRTLSVFNQDRKREMALPLADA